MISKYECLYPERDKCSSMLFHITELHLVQKRHTMEFSEAGEILEFLYVHKECISRVAKESITCMLKHIRRLFHKIREKSLNFLRL